MLLLHAQCSGIKTVTLKLLQHAKVAPYTLDTVQGHGMAELLLIVMLSTPWRRDLALLVC